jgi:hypothetical protein
MNIEVVVMCDMSRNSFKSSGTAKSSKVQGNWTSVEEIMN